MRCIAATLRPGLESASIMLGTVKAILRDECMPTPQAVHLQVWQAYIAQALCWYADHAAQTSTTDSGRSVQDTASDG